MKRRIGRCILALLALLVIGPIDLATRRALADASGCSFTDGGAAGFRRDDSGDNEIPACLAGGGGCYECAFSHTNQPGYDLCTETSGGMNCAPGVSGFPSWWPDPDYSDHGVPGDSPPPGDNPPGDGGGDDGGGVDLGGGGGGGGGFCDDSCAYGTVPIYGRQLPRHSAYHP